MAGDADKKGWSREEKLLLLAILVALVAALVPDWVDLLEWLGVAPGDVSRALGKVQEQRGWIAVALVAALTVLVLSKYLASISAAMKWVRRKAADRTEARLGRVERVAQTGLERWSIGVMRGVKTDALKVLRVSLSLYKRYGGERVLVTRGQVFRESLRMGEREQLRMLAKACDDLCGVGLLVRWDPNEVKQGVWVWLGAAAVAGDEHGELSRLVTNELALRREVGPSETGLGEPTGGFAGSGVSEREMWLKDTIRSLHPMAKRLLSLILNRYDPEGPGDQVVRHSMVSLPPGVSLRERRSLVQKAGAELFGKGLLSKWEWLPDSSGALVELHADVGPGLVVKARKWVSDALLDAGNTVR